VTTSYRNLIECQTEQQRIRALLEACEARLAAVKAERDAARAEVERLREDAARARWCEEKKASVFWSILAREWRVAVYDEAYNSLYTSKADRNAAIDAARGVK
jgi:hypothetical protein